MKIFNKTKNFIISEKAEIAETPLSRAKGLILCKRKDLIMVSPKESIRDSSIHMFFMLYPVDVIWLNSMFGVVDTKRKIPSWNPLKLKTWRIYRPKLPAKYVIELGKGEMGNTEQGDHIVFKV